MRIFLTGGTGFVGHHLLRRLLHDGHQVRCLVHTPRSSSTGPLQKLAEKNADRLELFPGDVVTGAGLEQGTAGCDAVIHLVGIILETKDASFERVHVLGTENVVKAARRAGVRRYVQMSALGARANGLSAYQRTKYRAEEIVRASGIPDVVLRPSLIFGPGDGFVTQMIHIMKTVPLVRPVVGTGKYRFRPIYIDDVVECFTQALTSEAAANRTINLVGGEELSLKELLQLVAECIGVRKPAVQIPMPLMRMAALVMSFLPARPPVTLDQLKMLKEGSTADPGEMMQIFNIHPISFRQGLRLYLCKQ